MLKFAFIEITSKSLTFEDKITKSTHHVIKNSLFSASPLRRHGVH
jgi:hypothetical protein